MLFGRKNKNVMPAEPPLVPVSGVGIDLARERCRQMVRKRALVSADTCTRTLAPRASRCALRGRSSGSARGVWTLT